MFNFKIVSGVNEGSLFENYDGKPFGMEYISFDDIIINDNSEIVRKKQNNKNSKYLEKNNNGYTE